MADPTIQTFCCHRGHIDANMSLKLMGEFNTTSYNILCLSSSIIGILGAICQILPISERVTQDNRTRIMPRTRGRKIIFWLAIADLMASLGVFVRSIVWIQYKNVMTSDNNDYEILFCVLASAWTQFFYMATWTWTLCFAVDAYLMIKNKPSYIHTFHMIAWALPAVLTATGLSILYIPNAECNSVASLRIAFKRILPNYCATYIPIAIVMIVNPIIYTLSCRDLETIVALPHAQITNKERYISDGLKCKFALINLVFYICWLPNIINGILLWTLWVNLPANTIIILWYIMAFMNPLQAFFNALVYRRWTPGAQKIRMPTIFCKPRLNDEESSVYTPLLRNNLRPSRLNLNISPQHTINASSSI